MGLSDAVVRPLVVVVLVLDAVLLAVTELAWIGLRAGGVPLPLAAVVAAVTTPVLVLAAEAAAPRSSAPVVVLAAWLVTVVGMGVWSPAGGGVMVADWRAILLVAAGFLPGLLAAGRRPPAPT